MQKSRTYRPSRGSGWKTFICYLIAFLIPLIWLYAGIWLIYPYRLSGTAPAFDFSLPVSVMKALQSLLPDRLSERDLCWIVLFAAVAIVSWLLTLILQLLWRLSASRAWNIRRKLHGIIARMRLTLLSILAVNLLGGYLLWKAGVSYIMRIGIWDILCYFLVFPLQVAAAATVSRLAAPPVISGKNAYFIRL